MGSRKGSGPLTTAYLDASAAVKLLRGEVESEALRAEIGRWRHWVSSEVLAVELRCAARRSRVGGELRRVGEILDRTELRPFDEPIRERAGETPFSPPLRALDAIHLATALTLRADLEILLAYDRELLAAAAAEGLATASPGQA